MRRLVMMIVTGVLMISMLTGCFGDVEVNDWAYAYTVGLEKGVSNKTRFTIQIPTLKGDGGEDSEESSQMTSDGYTYISIDAPSSLSGANMINTALSRKVNFMHTKIFVVSEDLAREGIGDILNAFLRFGQLRMITQLVIVKGSAREFIKNNKLVIGKSLPKTEEDIMNQEANAGLIDNIGIGEIVGQMKLLTMQATAPLAKLNDFSNQDYGEDNPGQLKSTGNYYAGELPRTGGDKAEYIGSAIFDGDKMVGELSGDETRMKLIASGEFQRAFITIEDPMKEGVPETFDVRQQKPPDIKVTLNGDSPIIDLKVFLEGDLIALRTNINYESKELKPVLENALEKYIKTEIERTIDKCKKLNCDVFAFGNEAIKKFATIQEWEAYNWKSHFKNAEVNVEVRFILRRTGTQIKTSPFKYAGDGE